MKRSDIRNAYDRMNPTQAQKERMRRAILAESRPQKSLNTVKSKKSGQKGMFGAVAACFAVMLIGGFVLAREAQVLENPVYTQPTETTSAVSPYDDILRTYLTALEEGWTVEQCQSADISENFANTDYAKANAGYCIIDLNGNGEKELIIGKGDLIWDLYAVAEDETIRHIISYEGSAAGYRVCENGIISMEWYGKTEGEVFYYALDKDFDEILLAETKLKYSGEDWYIETPEALWEYISQTEVDSIQSQYKAMKLELTYLVNLPDYLRDGNESVEQYMLILEKYKTALTENWTWEQCDQADISRQIMFDTTDKNNLGWCLIDLDENGVQELVISDGAYLFDLYTLMPTDGQPGHLLSAYPNLYTLCKDGTIERRENNYAVNTYWRWFHLVGIDLVEQGVLFYEGEKHQYSHGTSDDNLKIISEGEAGKYLVNSEKAAMNLTLTPFVEKQFPEVKEPNFYYEPLIEKYRQAIQENWDPGKCVENGISMMIGYYGELYDELGHNQIDLNGDGNDELIITDGTNIYDLYTIISDEEVGPLRLIDATERSQYFLTTDGYIYNMASGSAMLSYYYLLSIGQKELVFQMGLKFDASVDPNNPWSYYEGSMDKAVDCPTEEAAAIMDAIHFADIAFIPFE